MARMSVYALAYIWVVAPSREAATPVLRRMTRRPNGVVVQYDDLASMRIMLSMHDCIDAWIDEDEVKTVLPAGDDRP